MSSSTFWCTAEQVLRRTEPEFLNILKCNSAENASAGFQFNCLEIFHDKTPKYRHLDHFLGLLKFIQYTIYNLSAKKNYSCASPDVLPDLWKDTSLQKVDFFNLQLMFKYSGSDSFQRV